MNEKDFNQIIAKNIMYFMNLNGYTQAELASMLSVSEASVSNWINARKSPRMDKVDDMCRMFGVTRSDLLLERDIQNQSYYTDRETAIIAEQIHKSKELKLLFDAAKDAKPEDLQTTHQMLLALKRKEQGDD